MAEQGATALHGELARRDALTAVRLRPGDTMRIARALEVLEATGRSLLDWHRDQYAAEFFYRLEVIEGLAITPDVQLRSLDYLRNVENYYPYWYSARTRHMLSSYALYVRQLMGDVDTARRTIQRSLQAFLQKEHASSIEIALTHLGLTEEAAGNLGLARQHESLC